MTKLSSMPGLGHSLDTGWHLAKALRGNVFKAIGCLIKVAPDMKKVLKEPNRTLDELTEGIGEDSPVYNDSHDPKVLKNIGYGLVKPMARNFEKDMIDNESLVNIKKALVMISQGKNVAFYANHLSELDPTFFYMRLLEVDWDNVETTQNDYEYRDAEKIRLKNKINPDEKVDVKKEDIDFKSIIEQMYVVIGNKVRENSFKDYFAKMVNRMYVFQSKSKDGASEEDREKMHIFNKRSLVSMMRMKRDNPQTSIFVFPGGKRSRPKVDGEYMTDWDPEASSTLFKAMKIDWVVPIGFMGTENIHAPNGEKSDSDGINLRSTKQVCIKVRKPMHVDPKWDNTCAAENIDKMHGQVEKIITKLKYNCDHYEKPKDSTRP